MYKLLLGIEHLMTGVQVQCKDPVIFERESASVVRVTSDSPIRAYWPVKQAFLEAEDLPAEVLTHEAKFSNGEAEHYAKNVAAVMQDREQRSYDMQTYSRRPDYPGPDGIDSRYAPGEPSPFPMAVVRAMRRKHGAEADKFLAMLRWAGDHWFYHLGNMYLGVEPDGYIHS